MFSSSIFAALSLTWFLGAGPAASSPERYLDAQTQIVITAPSLGALATQLGDLYQRASAAPDFKELAAEYRAATTLIGFDPLDPKDLERAGLDPTRAVLIGTFEDEPVFVLPVKDPSQFDATLRHLAVVSASSAEPAEPKKGEAARPGIRSVAKVGDLEIVTFRADADTRPEFGYFMRDGQAILCDGRKAEQILPAVSAIPLEKSLAESAAWRSARATLGEDLDLVVYVPPGSGILEDVNAFHEGAAIGMRSGKTRMVMRALVSLGPDRLSRVRQLLGDLKSARSAGLAELKRLDPKAILALRWGGEMAAVASQLDVFADKELKQLSKRGADLRRDIIENLVPGAALSLSPVPGARLAEMHDDNPFQLMKIALELKVRDPAKVRRFFAHVKGLAKGKRVRFDTRRLPGGGNAWTLRKEGIAITWALNVDRFNVFVGPGKETPPSAGGFAAPTPDAKRALETGVGGMAVDFVGLIEALRGLTPDALGPDFMRRLVIEHWSDWVSQVRAASLRFDLIEGAALFDLVVEMKEAAR